MALTTLFPGRIGIWKCWFLRREENRRTRRKTLGRDGAGTRTNKKLTLVGGECFHHCAIPAPPGMSFKEENLVLQSKRGEMTAKFVVLILYPRVTSLQRGVLSGLVEKIARKGSGRGEGGLGS